MRDDAVAPLVARDEAERREHAGRLRDEHGADAELFGERARVERTGAAERDEREPARIVAALDRDDAQRAQHLSVHDLHHRSRDRCLSRARAAASRSRTSPPGSSAGSRPSRRFASVTVAPPPAP